jgi:hypothetical protein
MDVPLHVRLITTPLFRSPAILWRAAVVMKVFSLTGRLIGQKEFTHLPEEVFLKELTRMAVLMASFSFSCRNSLSPSRGGCGDLFTGKLNFLSLPAPLKNHALPLTRINYKAVQKNSAVYTPYAYGVRSAQLFCCGAELPAISAPRYENV